MIPVYQTRFVNSHGHGNCFNACLASILEMPLEIVGPDILPSTKGDWHEKWRIWLADLGYRLEVHLVGDEDDVTPTGYAIASVETTRVYPYGHRKSGENVFHAMVYKDGVLAHDPFPDGTTVKKIHYYQTLEVMTETQIRLHQASRHEFICDHGYRDQCVYCPPVDTL